MNRIRHLIERVHRSLKNAGVLRTIQRILQGIVPDRIFDINRVVYIQVVVKAALDESKDEPIQVELRHRWATEKDLDILMCGGLTQKQVQELFDAGARAVVTTASNGEMAAYYWMVPRHLDYFGWVRYNVAANEFWGAHNFVTPAYRGKGWRGNREISLTLSSCLKAIYTAPVWSKLTTRLVNARQQSPGAYILYSNGQLHSIPYRS